MNEWNVHTKNNLDFIILQAIKKSLYVLYRQYHT